MVAGRDDSARRPLRRVRWLPSVWAVLLRLPTSLLVAVGLVVGPPIMTCLTVWFLLLTHLGCDPSGPGPKPDYLVCEQVRYNKVVVAAYVGWTLVAVVAALLRGLRHRRARASRRADDARR